MSPLNPFAEWQNFYVVVGSAAAALTGLQFVAMALIADMPMGANELNEASSDAGSAFSTPSIVHFGMALLLAAVMVMPWHGVLHAAAVIGLMGVAGVAYVVSAARQFHQQTSYKPVLEDWLLRAVVPGVAYLALAMCGWLERTALRTALFGVAGVALTLMFVGIYGAWDNVTYIVFVKRKADAQR